MANVVKIPRGIVVGIGKVKAPRTQEFNYEIPMLSFLVISEAQESFVASCIHLHIDGYGATEKAAVDDMIDNIDYFLKANFKELSIENAWLNLKDLSHIDDAAKELWDAYRDVQYDLAAMDIPTDTVESLERKINQLQLRVEQLKSENKQLWEKLSLFVDYIPLRGAA